MFVIESTSSSPSEHFVKKIAATVLLVLVTLPFSVPAQGKTPEQRAAEKTLKVQKKEFKKFAKAQEREQKRVVKENAKAQKKAQKDAEKQQRDIQKQIQRENKRINGGH